MNNLTLNYLLADTLTPDELSFIYDLAFSCAYSNGTAVYTARTYYRAWYHDDTTQFNDDTICAYTGGTRMMWFPNTTTADTATSVNKQIMLFPNPAANTVYIVTSLNADETGIVDIYTVDGVKLNELKVTGGTTTSVVQTDNFADGIYLYYLHTDQQYEARGKLAIVR